MEKKKDAKKIALVIGILAVLLADAAGGYYFYQKSQYRPEAPEVVKVESANDALGIRPDTEAPVLILQNAENTMYVGNSNYDVSPLTYDKYGKVKVTYDDSEVNFNKAGTYELKVIATDTAGNTTEETATIVMKNKPTPKPTSTPSSSGDPGTDSSNDGGGDTGGGGTAMSAYDGYVCSAGAEAYCRDRWGWFNGITYSDNLGYTTDLQVGDWLTWDWGGKYPAGHVIVYIGGGQAFEANYDGNLHARITSVRWDYDFVVRHHQ